MIRQSDLTDITGTSVKFISDVEIGKNPTPEGQDLGWISQKEKYSQN